MGASIVVTSGKGGVGKSTVVVGLSRALASRGRRVLMIDCDAGLRSLDRMTGIEAELVYDISDLVHGHCAPIDAIYAGEPAGLYVLPAPGTDEGLIPPAIMENLLPFLKKYYDYVILDSPAGIGKGFRSAAAAADRAILVCSPDPVCVRGTAVVRDLLTKEGQAEQKLLINRFHPDWFSATGVYPDLDAIIDAAGVQLCGVVPDDYHMAAAFMRGEPAAENTPGMMAMTRIAGRLEGDAVPMGIE